MHLSSQASAIMSSTFLPMDHLTLCYSHQTGNKGPSSRYSSSTINYSQSTTELTPMDVDAETNRGISFKRFLTHANIIKNDDLSKKISMAHQWLSDALLRTKLDEFTFKAKTRDNSVTNSFVDFGNAILQAAIKEYNVPEERQIKLLRTSSLKTDDFPPDVAIVHVSVDCDNIVQRRRVDWRRILGSIQVWYPKKTSSKKIVNISADIACEEPPYKRLKSPTTTEPTSTHLSQQPNPLPSTPQHLAVSEADSSCSMTCGSPESTLYEESAEEIGRAHV